MMEGSRLQRFQLFVRIWCYASLVLFPTLLVTFTVRLPLIDRGGLLHWAIWDDVTGHVGPMLFVIYIVWALYLLRAVRDPLDHTLFFDFTMWANVAHGVLMMVQMLFSHHDGWKVLTDVPWVLVIAAIIAFLRPQAGSSISRADMGGAGRRSGARGADGHA